jgi:hypothetical protein
VNVKFLIEGEEEIGSPHLIPCLQRYKKRFQCVLVLISDTAMLDENQPAEQKTPFDPFILAEGCFLFKTAALPFRSDQRPLP